MTPPDEPSDDPAPRPAHAGAGEIGTVTRIARLAAGGSPLPEVLGRCVEAAARGLDVQRAKVMLREPDGRELWTARHVGWENGHGAGASVPLDADAQCARAVRSGEPVVTGEGPADEEPFLAGPPPSVSGVESGVAVAIPGGEDEAAVGTLAAHAGDRRSFSREDVGFLEALARAVSGAVAREARERRLKRALEESEERYRTIFEDTRDAVYVTDVDGTIVEMNPAGRALFGYTADELSEDVLAADLYHDPADRERFRRAIGEAGHVDGFEVRLETRTGEVRDCLLTATVRTDEKGEVVGYQGIIRDVTRKKQFEEQLRHRALHDPLTELPNRVLLWDRLEHAIARAARSGRGLAVLYLDLDRFKAVNDSLGHAAGDEVLSETARRLRRSIRDSDTAARVGGDEFVVLLEETGDEETARTVAERITSAFERPFRVAGEEVHVGASAGISMFEPDPDAPVRGEEAVDRLVRRADAAMTAAKGRPGADWTVFDSDDVPAGTGRLERESELRRALRKEELVLHYQPIVSLETGRVDAVEPLVRWEHPEQGLLLPGAFLPLAEETGLILELGYWTLETACEQLAEWNRTLRPEDPLHLHPNLSATQFEDPELPGRLEAVLAEAAVESRLLELEVTEHLVIRAPRRARELRELGAGICVDDFGTGYSSLAYLKDLRVDCLKIDMSFVQGLGRTPEDEAIADTILTLGEALALDVVAEGVEEEHQLRWLEERRCGWGQGFYFARPAPAEDVEAALTG